MCSASLGLCSSSEQITLVSHPWGPVQQWPAFCGWNKMMKQQMGWKPRIRVKARFPPRPSDQTGPVRVNPEVPLAVPAPPDWGHSPTGVCSAFTPLPLWRCRHIARLPGPGIRGKHEWKRPTGDNGHVIRPVSEENSPRCVSENGRISL